MKNTKVEIPDNVVIILGLMLILFVISLDFLLFYGLLSLVGWLLNWDLGLKDITGLYILFLLLRGLFKATGGTKNVK